MEILRMNENHIAAVAELEKLCFCDPWSENSIASELKNPLSLWLVAVEGENLCGYIGSQSVMDEADMMNVAVHPDFRRQGVGQRLVDSLVSALKERKVQSLALEVRVSNESAVALYKKLGFATVGCRPNYYRHPKEDAYIMRKEWAI